jgi:ABC-2 type transport system ATP-binding protein
MNKEIALEVHELQKNYGTTKAVDKLSFTVHSGEIFGLLGPNGAGKTTTLECVEGLRKPDGGRISVLGIQPGTSRRLWDAIGVQLQSSALPDTMTPRESLAFFSHYHGIKPDYAILERMGLSRKMNDQCANLSTGQKRRLSLALCVAHNPELVFLDEPTAGLDVESRMELHTMMRQLRDEGKTIVIATHDMAEAQKLCDTIGIVIAGKLAVIGTPAQVTASGDQRTRISISSEFGTVGRQKPDLPKANFINEKDGYTLYQSDSPGDSVVALMAFIAEQQDVLVDLRVERPSLEERFMEILEKRRNGK